MVHADDWCAFRYKVVRSTRLSPILTHQVLAVLIVLWQPATIASSVNGHARRSLAMRFARSRVVPPKRRGAAAGLPRPVGGWFSRGDESISKFSVAVGGWGGVRCGGLDPSHPIQRFWKCASPLFTLAGRFVGAGAEAFAIADRGQYIGGRRGSEIERRTRGARAAGTLRRTSGAHRPHAARLSPVRPIKHG